MGARRNKQPQEKSGAMQLLSPRVLKWLSSGVFFLSAILIVNALYAPTTLPFKTIQVYGDLHWLNREELNSIVLHDLRGGFFSLDVNGLKQNLEQHPWVKSVSIRRVWPDVLQIAVTEQKPLAVWNQDSIISQSGEVFVPAVKQFPAGLTQINGPEGMQQALVKHYNALLDMLAPLGLQIKDINVNQRRAMEVTLGNGVQLLLGRVRDEVDSTTEMMRFVRAYSAALAPKIDRVQVVDLRYTNGIAVRWKQQSEIQGDNNKSALKVG